MPSALKDEPLAAELPFAVALGLGEVDALLLAAPADAAAGVETFADALGVAAAAGEAELTPAAAGVDTAADAGLEALPAAGVEEESPPTVTEALRQLESGPALIV